MLEHFLGVGKIALLVVARSDEQPQKYSRSIRLFDSLGSTFGLAPSACIGRDTFG